MKIKGIRKYASGGGFMASIYLPVTTSSGSNTAAIAASLLQGSLGGSTTSSSKSSTKSTTKSDGDITLKDLLTSLSKINGLNNDVLYITAKVAQDLSTAQAMDPLGLNTAKNLVSRYLQDINYINQARANKELFNLAYLLASKKGALSEYAVTTNGGVVVTDADGNIQTMSMLDYFSNKDKYKALTNSEVLAQRKDNPNYRMNNNLTSIVGNSTSTQEILATIKLFTEGLGTSKVSLNGVTKKEGESIAGGMMVLQEAAKKYGAEAVLDAVKNDGFYKTSVLTSDLREQAVAAIKAILQMLPLNQRTLLLMQAEGDSEKASDLLINLVTKGLKNEFSFKVQPAGSSGSSNSSGASGAGGDKQDIANRITSMQRGLLGTDGTFTLNPGTTAQITVDGVNYGLLYDKENKPVLTTSLSNMLALSHLQGISSTGSIYFGDLAIDSKHLKDIVYDDKGVTRVLLPAILTKDGLYKPDFDVIKQYQEACAAVRAKGLNPHDVNDLKAQAALGKELRARKLYDLTDANGLPNMKRFGTFLVADGYATSKSGIEKESDYVKDVSDQEDLYDYAIEALSPDDKHKYELDKPSWAPGDWFSMYDHIYQGSIYIPISNNEGAGMYASGNESKTYEVEAREREYQRFLKLKQASGYLTKL